MNSRCREATAGCFEDGKAFGVFHPNEASITSVTFLNITHTWGKRLQVAISIPSLSTNIAPTLRMRLGLKALARNAFCMFAPGTTCSGALK